MKTVISTLAKLFPEEFVSYKRDNSILKGLEKLLDKEKTVLDVGCSTGRFSKKVQDKFNLKIQGIDVFIPQKPKISVELFDGKKLPFKKNSFDSVFLIDVLHHIKKSDKILKDSLRVAKNSVIIKDHYYENFFDLTVLKIADFLGNARHGIDTPFYFKTKKEWKKILAKHDYEKIEWRSNIFPKITFPQVMYKIKL